MSTHEEDIEYLVKINDVKFALDDICTFLQKAFLDEAYACAHGTRSTILTNREFLIKKKDLARKTNALVETKRLSKRDRQEIDATHRAMNELKPYVKKEVPTGRAHSMSAVVRCHRACHDLYETMEGLSKEAESSLHAD